MRHWIRQTLNRWLGLCLDWVAWGCGFPVILQTHRDGTLQPSSNLPPLNSSHITLTGFHSCPLQRHPRQRSLFQHVYLVKLANTNQNHTLLWLGGQKAEVGFARSSLDGLNWLRDLNPWPLLKEVQKIPSPLYGVRNRPGRAGDGTAWGAAVWQM